MPKGPSAATGPAVSSAAIGGEVERSLVRATPPGTGAHEAHGLVAVGPGFAGSMLVAGGYGMNPLPIQPAKIHCPLERSDTLSRERLNSWLERASEGRLGLIVAEAGFGKTTLLGDWARHTRRMTAWYRLESDDRDWLTFIRHLVASGRELDPGFAPATFAMLVALGGGGPTQQDLTVSIAREMAELGAASERGLTLILDDYHLVDGFHETEPIVRALLDRTGPGFSLVIASRSMPTLPLGRLRTRGGVMTLRSRELCFDEVETSNLFDEVYQHPLERDIAEELCTRTDGWAALLVLARTRIEESGDARAIVSRLGATEGHLYAFLAEEVVESLEPDLTAFLTRVSLLTAVDPRQAALIDPRPALEIAAAIGEAERLGLLSRPDTGSAHLFHPLVREFLAARLEAEVGAEAVRATHRAVAIALEGTDWHAAAWHYRQAGAVEDVARVVDGSITTILAEGSAERARPFLDGASGPMHRAGALILRSRLELERGSLRRGRELAQEAEAAARGTELAGLAVRNLSAMHARQGFGHQSVELATRALSSSLSEPERQVAVATVVVSGTQDEGNLVEAAEYLNSLAQDQEAAGYLRYASVTRLNQAVILLWTGLPEEAAQTARRAEADLQFAPDGPERVAATAVRTAALVQLGDRDALGRLVSLADTARTAVARDEAAIEGARLMSEYGSCETAASLLAKVSEDSLHAGFLGCSSAIRSMLALRAGELGAARHALLQAAGDLQDAVGKFRLLLADARIAVAEGRDATPQLAELDRLATVQSSQLCSGLAVLLRALALAADDPAEANAAILRLMPRETHLLSVLAEESCRALPVLGPEQMVRVRDEARGRPDRWASALRLVFTQERRAAELLAEIGGREDAAALRAAAGSKKWLRPVAAAITRRLSDVVVIRDMGPVTILIGSKSPSRPMRRKVLALLCFLSSRPAMAATRDEAIEAIWADLNPDTAVNSLHQTIYFLRRVFDAAYREGISAEYVTFDGEILALDHELVRTSSSRCWELIGQARTGSPGALTDLTEEYRGTFALDFAYEDWAATYRENLHAAFLSVVEAGIRGAVESSEFDRAIALGQRALGVDPQADAVELELLRAYKASGRHAAAAEQYAHYSAYVRGELGTEPPPYSAI